MTGDQCGLPALLYPQHPARTSMCGDSPQHMTAIRVTLVILYVNHAGKNPSVRLYLDKETGTNADTVEIDVN